MIRLRVWWSRAIDLVLGRSRDRRLADEIQAHLDHIADAHIARGMSPHEARLAARRDFGGVDQVTAVYREHRGLPLVEGLTQDTRYALRMILNDRWFTAAVVTALALGLAVSTTMVTIVYGMNLRPMPFDRPSSLVAIGAERSRTHGGNVSSSVFEAWRSAARSMTGMAAHLDTLVTVGDQTHAADQFSATFISHDGFAVLGVQPLLGRDFRPEDDRPGAPGVVILGHGLWVSWYGSQSSAIGSTVRVNGEPATVIGVMPEGFRFPTRSDLWRPMASRRAISTSEPAERPVHIVARLADNVTIELARAELGAISSSLPAMIEGGRTRRPVVLGLNEAIVGRITDPVPLMLLVAVGVVLLIACVHAANLLLARSAVRAREMSLRATIGASRGRIIRQLLVESILLSVAAGAIGFALARFGVRWFANETVGFGLPFWTTFDFDARLFAGLSAITLGTGILFGLLPAWHLSGTNLNEVLNQAERQGGAGPRARRMTTVLLIGELAAAVVLLTCAGLLVSSASVLSRADQIIDAANLWEFRLSLPQPQYESEARRTALYRRLDDRLAARPGLQSAALASAPPFVGGERRAVVMDDEPHASGATARTTRMIAIGDRYFDTLGLALLRGTGFEALDEAARRDSVLVNERFIEVFSPDQDAIGRRVGLIDPRVPDAPHSSLTIRGVAPAIRQEQNGDHQPVVYIPHGTNTTNSASILIRGTPNAFADALRQEVRAIDPDLPIYGLRSLTRVSEVSRWYQRSSSLMFTVFAGVTLILSALGVYAITAYAVAQRTQEIGIRMAVGAQASQVLWLFIRGALVHVSIGLAIGVAGALGAGVVLRGLLIRTSAADPWTIAAVCVLLTLVALTASLVPARRAARMDPIATLRHD